MESKQTAIQWLMEELESYGDRHHCKLEWEDLESLIQQALEMEKEQIILANEDCSTNELGEFISGEQYYNETYGM
jgi:hypothetical protein